MFETASTPESKDPVNTGLEFRCYAFRFHFVTHDEVRFPASAPENILRGAFGAILRRRACEPECADPASCPRPERCAYARIFAPRASLQTARFAGDGVRPSGFADLPRPFVFRAWHLGGQLLRPQTPFHFDLHLFFGTQPEWEPFVASFAELAHTGLGPGRGRAELVRVEQDGRALYERGGATGLEPQVIRIPLTCAHEEAESDASVKRVKVEFLTPTELKSGGMVAAEPEFGLLFARARDRVCTLQALYGGESAEGLDFKALGERAAAVRMIHWQAERVNYTRRSTRTGHSHPLSGLIGAAEYESDEDLRPLLPFLRAAQWAGVGRQTVWGHGAIRVTFPG